MSKNPNRFYVYVHRRLSDGVIFYVGKGSAYRDRDTNNRNAHWHKIVNKHGFFYERIYENLNEKCAYSIEKIMISVLPNLANYAAGGEINSGYKWSEEQRNNVSLLRRGVKRGPRTEETKAKLSIANTGKKHSEETKKKMSIIKKSNPLPELFVIRGRTAMLGAKNSKEAIEKTKAALKKPVICVNDGKIFDSMDAAAKAYQVSVASISCCCSGKVKSVKGLQFKKVQKDL